jgi:Tfp pilus assembly protein PilN
VRAVNLVPADQRRGGGGPGRSGPAVYFVLGALAVLVVAAASYVLAGNQVNSRKAEVARSKDDAAQLEQQATALRPYQDFASLSRTRAQTVASLAASRFDWDRAMRELARALPGDVWLTSLLGTVSPGVSIDSAGSGGGTDSLRNTLQVPAVQLVGCTESQAAVSRVMARLRTINRVQRVSLASSEKTENAAGGGSAAGGGLGASSSDCRNGSGRFPQFQLVIFFKAPSGASAPASPGQPGVPQSGQSQGAQPSTTPASSGAAQ